MWKTNSYFIITDLNKSCRVFPSLFFFPSFSRNENMEVTFKFYLLLRLRPPPDSCTKLSVIPAPPSKSCFRSHTASVNTARPPDVTAASRRPRSPPRPPTGPVAPRPEAGSCPPTPGTRRHRTSSRQGNEQSKRCGSVPTPPAARLRSDVGWRRRSERTWRNEGMWQFEGVRQLL